MVNINDRRLVVVVATLIILSLTGCATPSDSLFLAIDQNNVAKATALLDADVSPKLVDRNGIPALSVALARRSERLAQLLLARGADPNQPDAAGDTAVAYLSPQVELTQGRISTGGLLVDILLEQTFAPDQRLVCARELSAETTRRVIDRVNNLDALDSAQLTPLMRAGACGHIRTAEMLLACIMH